MPTGFVAEPLGSGLTWTALCSQRSGGTHKAPPVLQNHPGHLDCGPEGASESQLLEGDRPDFLS